MPGPEEIPCEGGCGVMVKWDSVHRVEFGDTKNKNLCDACCPNCWGGTGNGPGDNV